MSSLIQKSADTSSNRISISARWRERLSVNLRRATIANCAIVLAALVLICVVSEQWWLSAALSYLPRATLLLPTLLLFVPAAVFAGRLFAAANVLCGVIVLGPIMGLTAPVNGTSRAHTGGSPAPLRIVSCNAQNGASDLPRILAELDALDPDIVALQETKWGCEILEEYFTGWHTVHEGEFWVSSKYPLRLIDVCAPEAFERQSAIVCEVAAPQGTFNICDVHLATPRHGLGDLRWHSPISQTGVKNFEWYQWQRELESTETRRFLETVAEHPTIALGDFNTPTGSSLFVPIWGRGLISAFDAVGWGYGYTVPCNTDRFWPPNTPWARIDHILCDAVWSIHACGIGASAGSDHRLIWADVSIDVDRGSASAVKSIGDDRQVVGF